MIWSHERCGDDWCASNKWSSYFRWPIPHGLGRLIYSLSFYFDLCFNILIFLFLYIKFIQFKLFICRWFGAMKDVVATGVPATNGLLTSDGQSRTDLGG
jgi:hypothetical protein